MELKKFPCPHCGKDIEARSLAKFAMDLLMEQAFNAMVSMPAPPPTEAPKDAG